MTAAILAAYTAVAPMETFIATQNDRHPTDLADLRGRPPGGHLPKPNTAAVGRNQDEGANRWRPNSRHFMRQDFFTYLPPSS